MVAQVISSVCIWCVGYATVKRTYDRELEASIKEILP